MIRAYINEEDGLVCIKCAKQFIDPLGDVKIMHLISDLPESPNNEELYEFARKVIEVAQHD